jgi:hypothetical protein
MTGRNIASHGFQPWDALSAPKRHDDIRRIHYGPNDALARVINSSNKGADLDYGSLLVLTTNRAEVSRRNTFGRSA